MFLAFCILSWGFGLGAFSTWLAQAAARKQVRQEVEAQIAQALFGGYRDRKLEDRESGPFRRPSASDRRTPPSVPD